MNQSVYTFANKFALPRSLVLFADLLITVAGFWAAYILRMNFNFGEIPIDSLKTQTVFLILPVYLITFVISGSFKGIIRHSSIEDATRLAAAITGAMLALFSLSHAFRLISAQSVWFLPYSVILIHAALVSVSIMGSRLIIRELYYSYIFHHKGYRKVLIFGAGEIGKITQNLLENDQYSRIHVIGFIDDDKALIGKRLIGKPIYSEDYIFNKLLKVVEIREIILAVDRGNITPSRKKSLFDRCLSAGLGVREVSPFKDWINGQLSTNQIRDLKIDELLGREPIKLNLTVIAKSLKNAVVLVTGAAGSIGSEIIRQLLAFELKKVILLDQAESALYDLQYELKAKFPGANFDLIIGNVTDRHRMRQVFENYRPAYVFNAAAYKHVPLMEATPYEAIHVNVGGCRLLADLSVEFGVRKFVMISTDKAVNPTNVMGASKRICELYIQALAQANHSSTQFITTRFGNVLGSNGSVIPLFKKQIEAGGPVTVTHREIIRYFMTIPEACQLVLEAGFMGRGGEIFMFDMGDPVKIYDLATQMIFLAGLKPEVDIPVEITGLRPGEKLYEELLTDKENTIPTHHTKIKLAKVCRLDFGSIKFMVDALLIASQIESDEELVCRMKTLVPEYVSHNSKFSTYDPVIVRNGHPQPRKKSLRTGRQNKNYQESE